MRYFLLLTFSVFSFANDHSISTNFSDCEGKIVNYYVSKLLPMGSVEGMMEATKMHREFYKKRGAEVKVYPAIQYKRVDGGGTEESLHRLSTMVVWENNQSWENWRDRFNALSDRDRKRERKEYDAFVSKYNENTEVVAERRWCML